MDPPVVAVINTSPDIINMLRLAFEHAGFVTVSLFTHDIRDGKADLDRFIAQHDPRVIVYDIAPPYQANWQLFQHLAKRPSLSNRFFVLTTTNVAHVEKLAGSRQPIYEIVGKPYDLDRLTQAVKEAARARLTR